MGEKKPIKFSWADPQHEIVSFEATVLAETNEDAVYMLVRYLVELKRRFSSAPAPLKDSSDPKEIGQELIRRPNDTTDPVGFVLTLHLFCEHWLNLILKKFFPHRDLTKWRVFYQKLELIAAGGKIPSELFGNLSKLNDLRTSVAHDLSFDLTNMKLNYQPDHEDFNPIHYKPSFAPNAEQHHVFNVLKVLAEVTYWSLHKHCIEELGFKREISGATNPDNAKQGNSSGV